GGSSLELSLFSTASDMVDTVDLTASGMDGLRREAEKFAEDWRATTETLHPCIGARLVDRAIGGVEVIDVVPGLPAAKAGILPGVLITGVDGSPVAAKAELDRAIARGGAHHLALSRRGIESDASVDTAPCMVETPVGAGGYLYNLKLVDSAGYLENVPAVEGVAGDERGIAALDLGNVYMRLGEYGKAVESYGEVNMASKAGVCTGTALFRMGEAYEKLGRWTEAAYAFRQAMLLYPDATLSGAEGPKVVPIAKERLMKLYDAGLVMDRWWL
ncbi:MAG TPA: tetratricopeptide repeat protein, partial [Nitrospirota bacterium]